ncbi:DUF6745 domain-containing protein [Symbioplanes lichenis]|uniref:DUF6745 domain-containing protein n=1 Tax=Symbioplanes lichenis TaxID=1629072 RepID=UPI00273A4102|nr:hypothetical protein [Actinoplanes lichenis]
MQLTPAQETAAAAVEDQWLAAGLATGPAHRPAAEEAVALAYRAAGLEPPTHVYWLSSPRAGAVAAALLASPSPQGASPLSGAVPSWVRDVESELRRQGWHPALTAGPAVRTAVRSAPWSAARATALATFGMEGWAQLSAAAGRRAWTLIMDRIAARLRTRLREDLADLPAALATPAARAVLDAVYGQHDAAWLATFAAADTLTAAGRPSPSPGSSSAPSPSSSSALSPSSAAPSSAAFSALSPSSAAPSSAAFSATAFLGDGPSSARGSLAGLAAVAQEAGWWWPFADAVILTERPTMLSRDNVGRLHSETAALQFPDGYHLWAWRGMPIPAALASELPTLTTDRIKAEPNAEIRRVMLEHYGYDRYLRDSGAHKQHTDETGTLWHLALPNDEPLVMVEVVNATPEPDGTHRIYWLRVPPRTRTAREGVAWTFGLTADEYHPQIQT